MGSPLRIFFFSDWRIQSLELAEELIRSVAPVDVIVYGGDDVVRFVPPLSAPAMLTVASRTYFPESVIPPDELSNVLFAISEQLGQEPRSFWPRRALTLRQVFALYHDPSPANNWLTKFAQYARYGVFGVIGNDCGPADRAALRAPGVRDLHTEPTVIENVGFLGIEGAICAGSRNHIGFVLHTEEEVREHLRRSLHDLGALPGRLVIVSHTPPAGCALASNASVPKYSGTSSSNESPPSFSAATAIAEAASLRSWGEHSWSMLPPMIRTLAVRTPL